MFASTIRSSARWLRGLLLGKRGFAAMQKIGVHVTPVHYYFPIPDTRTFPPALWARKSKMVGVDLRLPQQREMLRSFAAKYRREYESFPQNQTSDPSQFFLRNGFFETVDAEILHCIIRENRPRRVIEIGSGNSSLIIAAALRQNLAEGAPAAEFSIVDPYVSDRATHGIAGPLTVIRTPVENVDLAIFEALRAGDVLFIDSTHVLRTGSDVCYEFLEILPRLAAGVIVHVHDIFLPGEYPREWVEDLHYFWNEQYLLQAFLCYNSQFEVLWAGRAMSDQHADDLRTAISSYEPSTNWPASFWIRRVT